MADFTYTPSYGTALVKKPRNNEVQFGDGYAQGSGDGINTNLRKYNLIYKNIPVADANAIDAFLESYNGYQSFTWDDPDGNTVTVKCKQWNKVYVNPVVSDMNMLFEEVPA